MLLVMQEVFYKRKKKWKHHIPVYLFFFHGAMDIGNKWLQGHSEAQTLIKF